MRSTLDGVILVLFVLCAGRDVSPQKTDQSLDVAAARKTVIAVMNLREGDAAGLNHARAAFTADGWQGFMKRMQGFLDDKGAPTFTSTFVARDARVLGDQGGIVHLRIPGILTQSNRVGKTTYEHFAVEVYLIRDAGEIKIQRLEQITCVGASMECS